MVKSRVYKSAGFTLLGLLETGGLRHYLADTDTILKGDIIHDDGNGKGTNAITAIAVTLLGVAAAGCDNSGDDDLYVQVIPAYQHYQFIVPVEANAVITQTAVGLLVDLESVNTIDLNDTSIAAGPGFKIDAIDISTEAIAANTYGYAIGHFEYQS